MTNLEQLLERAKEAWETAALTVAGEIYRVISDQIECAKNHLPS